MARLILVNRYFFPEESATSQFATDLARHLAASRAVEVLASRQLLEDASARLPPSATLDGVRIHRLWSTRFGRGGIAGRALDYASFLAAAGLWLLCHARRGDTVLTKTDPPLLGVVATLATFWRAVARVQWLQDLYPETAERLAVLREGGLLARVARALRDWSLRSSDLIVGVSIGILKHVRRRAGPARLLHIPNWADDYGPYVPPPGDAPFTVGYSGNLGRAHPIAGLAQLAELAQDPAIRFLVTGGGAHYERLREQVRALDRPQWAFLPYQPRAQLGELLRRSHVHVVIQDPRVEHTVFPSKLYGILSAGRPVLHLGNPAGELALLLEQEHCGWSLAADAGAPMLALLERLRANPAALAEAGRNARRAYERHFARDKALAAWAGALDAVGRQTV